MKIYNKFSILSSEFCIVFFKLNCSCVQNPAFPTSVSISVSSVDLWFWAEYRMECIDRAVWVSSHSPSTAQLPRVCLPSDSQLSGLARQRGHLLIGNGPPLPDPSSPSTLTRCHLSLSQQTFPVSTHLFLTYWKLLEMFLPCLPPPPQRAH